MAGRRALLAGWRLLDPLASITRAARRYPSPARSLRRIPATDRELLCTACFSTQAKVEAKCWSCGAVAPPGPFMLCPSCRIIQPADSSTNHFEIFALEKKYELDPAVLEKRYKDLQRKLHPDLFGMKSEKEKAYSADQSSQVINAYQTLLRPVSRATYLLQTLGVDVEEEGTVNDPDILMEVMDMQEAVSDCAETSKLYELQNKARSRLKDYEKAFIQAMNETDLGAAKEALQRMCYFQRIINNITEKL